MSETGILNRKAAFLLILCTAFVYENPARGQAPAVTLQIELSNVVEYHRRVRPFQMVEQSQYHAWQLLCSEVYG